MYALATRNALRRAAVAPVARTAAVAQRFSSTMHDNDPDVLEAEKHRNLKGEQHETSSTVKHAPGWNQYLASASEAAVKADGDNHSINDLQAQTLEHVKKRHGDHNSPASKPGEIPQTPKGAVSGEERVDAYEATYERDDLSGPLKNSALKNAKPSSSG